jgi:peptidyl-prolyl cis-trans isomerase D
VKDDIAHFARRRAQEEVAAKLLAAVKAGQTLEDAATVAGVSYRRTGRTGRAEPAEGVARELIAPLFLLKPGEATMVEMPDSFLVATAVEVVQSDPKTDEAGYARVSEGLAQAMANDAESAFVNALRNRAKPRVNQKIVDSFVQP